MHKNLKYAERDFRHIKSHDLDLRPVFHRLEERVRSHMLICMLACYLAWHLRKAWAPLTFTDQNPPAPVPMLAEPTSTQREAFSLLGSPIPLTLALPEHPPGQPGKTPGQAQNCRPNWP